MNLFIDDRSDCHTVRVHANLPQTKHRRTIDDSLNDRIDRLVDSDSAFRQLRLWKCHDDVSPCHDRSILA